MGVAYTMKMGLWESNISVVLLGEAVESRTPDGESPVAESITSLRSNPRAWGTQKVEFLYKLFELKLVIVTIRLRLFMEYQE